MNFSDLLAQAIKNVQKERHLTQKQLGELVGVQKAQISKIENSTTDVRFGTILKVFKALNAKVNFNVNLKPRISVLTSVVSIAYRTTNGFMQPVSRSI